MRRALATITEALLGAPEEAFDQNRHSVHHATADVAGRCDRVPRAAGHPGSVAVLTSPEAGWGTKSAAAFMMPSVARFGGSGMQSCHPDTLYFRNNSGEK
jgi:hypothetical protein